MGLPSKDIFQSTIDSALAEAELIAFKAKMNPEIFIRPDIGAWGGKYVASRYNNVYNTSDRGKFDLWDQEAGAQTRADFQGVLIDPPTQEQLTALADGDEAGSDAVFKQIARIRSLYSATAIANWYAGYARALSARDIAGGRSAYYSLFRGILMELMKLYNTMLLRMAQLKEKPMPTEAPPAGYHWGHGNTPFNEHDWVLVKDAVAVPADETPLTGITVGQFKNIVAILLGK